MSGSPIKSHVQEKWVAAFNFLNRDQPGITGLLDFAKAWNLAVEYITPKNAASPPSTTYDIHEVDRAFQLIRDAHLEPKLADTFQAKMNETLDLLQDEISRHVEQYEVSNDVDEFAGLFPRLVEWYHLWKAPVIQYNLPLNFDTHFRTHLFSVIPPAFVHPLKALLTATLSRPPNPLLFDQFDMLGIISQYESLIASVIYTEIERKIQETCPKKWGELMLNNLRKWVVDDIGPWLMTHYTRNISAEESRTVVGSVLGKFDYHLCKTLCTLRTNEIFDIIVDYPDSMSALHDLRECLARVDGRMELVQTLRKLNKRRLLHPGADTKVIISQYVSTIRCLRVVDPPGVLLFKVADPIRRYLRDRPDTCRSIVASLVGEGGELVEENEQPMSTSAMVDDYSDPNWEPEPIDAGPDFRTSKPSDVISTLVSIYDSKDLFVKELQVLLAQRLLAITDGNFDKEIRNLEILKLRFGEAALQVCEVMLKDMNDSRRIDQHVQSQKPSVLHPTIISRNFWPTLQSTAIKMPGQLLEIQKDYEKEFNAFKPDKRLRWLPHLGTVLLEIELEDRTLQVEASPLESAIIELFSGQPIWTLEALGQQLGGVEAKSVLSALNQWADQGVLKDMNNDSQTWKLLEVREERSGVSKPTPRHVAAIEETPAVITMQQQQAEQMKVYWRFIQGMLTNFGTLSIDRIQSFLKYAPGYDRTPEQLAVFLEAARREGLVDNVDGNWKLSA